MHGEPLLLVYKSLIPGGSFSTPHQISLQTLRLSAASIHQTKLKMCELQVMRVFFSIFMFLLHILKLLVILSQQKLLPTQNSFSVILGIVNNIQLEWEQQISMTPASFIVSLTYLGRENLNRINVKTDLACGHVCEKLSSLLSWMSQ